MILKIPLIYIVPFIKGIEQWQRANFEGRANGMTFGGKWSEHPLKALSFALLRSQFLPKYRISHAAWFRLCYTRIRCDLGEQFHSMAEKKCTKAASEKKSKIKWNDVQGRPLLRNNKTDCVEVIGGATRPASQMIYSAAFCPLQGVIRSGGAEQINTDVANLLFLSAPSSVRAFVCKLSTFWYIYTLGKQNAHWKGCGEMCRGAATICGVSSRLIVKTHRGTLAAQKCALVIYIEHRNAAALLLFALKRSSRCFSGGV